MDPSTVAGLAALALIDSTSIGTLVIPIWLMLLPAPVRRGAVPFYLATITLFYFLVGVALLAGARFVVAAGEAMFDSPLFDWGQLVLGVALFGLSFVIDRRQKGDDAAATRWPDRINHAVGSPRGVVGLAAVAGLLELPTMLPYLGALALMMGAALTWPALLVVLVLYCTVMILPATVLLLVRNLSASWLDPRLQGLSAWFSRHLTGATSWIVGILGVLVVIDAAGRLSLF